MVPDFLAELKGGKRTPKKIDAPDHASIGLAFARPAAYDRGAAKRKQ